MFGNKSLKFLYRLSGLLIIGFLIYWFRIPSVGDRSDSSTANGISQEQSYFTMQDITLRRYDDAGNINMLTTADQARQDNQDKEISLTDAELQSIEWSTKTSTSNTLATVKSPAAIFLPGTTSILLCDDMDTCLNSMTASFEVADTDSATQSGRVSSRVSNREPKPSPFDDLSDNEIVTLTDLSTEPPTVVKSTLLLYDSETRQMTNNHYTEVIRGNNRLSGDGLNANVAQHEYQLQRNVSTFVRPTATN